MVKKLVATVALAAFLLLPGTSAVASEATASVKVTACPPGYTGYVVWHWNEKRGWYELASYCIPWGP